MKKGIYEDELFPCYSIYDCLPEDPDGIEIPDDLAARFDAVSAEFEKLNNEIDRIYHEWRNKTGRDCDAEPAMPGECPQCGRDGLHKRKSLAERETLVCHGCGHEWQIDTETDH